MTTERGGVPTPTSPGVVLSPSSAAAQTPIPPSDKAELPWAFIDCPSDTLVVLIAHMLELLCQHNDQVVLTPDALTRFHSRAPPGISIVEYLRRIVRYTNLEKIPLLSLLAYIDLTCQNLPTFTLSSLTVHRFLIAGVTAGSKAQCDVFCTNSHYAKVGGIKVTELNSLEREFLRVTGWALCCTSDLLQRYYSSLIRSHGGFTQAPEPEESPFLAFPHAGEAPAVESIPPTPADSGADDEEGMVSDQSEGGGEGHERGRSRVREVDAVMEVDSPVVKSTGPPGQQDTGVETTETTTTGTGTGSGRSGGLKSLVGGIFRRHDHAEKGRPAAPAETLAPPKSRSRSRARSRTRSRSRPGVSPAASPGITPELPRQLTPRVRTRDERSVESLRGGVERSLPPAVVVEDGKRRARVE